MRRIHSLLFVSVVSLSLTAPSLSAQAPGSSPQNAVSVRSDLLPRAEQVRPPRLFITEELEQRLINVAPLRRVEPEVSRNEAEILQQAVELQKDSPAAAANFLEGQIGNLPDGETPSAMFDFFIGVLYQQMGDNEKAKGWYENAIEKKDDFLRARKNLGVLEAINGNFDGAEPHLNKAVELGAADALVLGLLGFVHQQNERYVAAEAAYRQALIFAPNERNWKVNLASTLLQQQRNAEAKALLDTLIEADPNESRFWLFQATALTGMGELRQAAANFEVVRAMGEADYRVLLQLGDIYLTLNAIEMAADLYIESVQADDAGDPARPISNVRTLSRYGALAKAEALAQAIRGGYGAKLDDDQRTELLTVESQIQLAQGQREEAAATLKELIQGDPSAGSAMITLADYYADISEDGEALRQDAKDLYSHAADLTGQPEVVARANLRWGILLVRERNYTEALQKLRASNSLEPQAFKEDYIRQVERALGASL